MPGNIELSGLEISLIGVISRETILREYIEQVREYYNYIIIDCMPSLGRAAEISAEVVHIIRSFYISYTEYDRFLSYKRHQLLVF